MQPKTLKEVALSQEVRIAVSFIQEGLICLNRLDDVNDFVYLPLLLLSTGFERLLKVIICLDCLADKGQFPDSQHVRKTIKTHNLECLLKKVIIIANNWKYTERCAATKKDMAFLPNDADLQKVVSLLAAYGQQARYYHMDIIFGRANSTDDPEQCFESYCADICARQPNWQQQIMRKTLGETMDANIRYINRQVTKHLQKLARCLCRMFTLGELGPLAKLQTGTITHFLFLSDEDLDKIQTI